MMKNNLKKNSLTVQIWTYLLLFSVIILAFLWFFQVIFLKTYYKSVKKREIKQVARTLIKNKENQNLPEMIDNIAYDKSICLEIIDHTLLSLEATSILSSGCLINYQKDFSYKKDFILSNQKDKTYYFQNPRFKNDILVYAVKLDKNIYAFINTSLDPIDSTTSILKNQLIYVTILVLILEIVITYFISRHISNPIIRINQAAKKMASGKYDAVFSVKEDIQEINELIETLNYTNKELKKTDELRRDLMANVSHDLKTPLTMIKAYAEMARDLNHKNIKKRTQNLNVIIEEVDRLTILVNDILTLSKMQAETDALIYEYFDLIELIKNILKRYEVLVTLEDYIFKFNYEANKIIIYADKKKIEQVIYNLINNAIHYSGEDKTIEIEVHIKNEIRVEIIDHGEGILEKDIHKIWDKYYKNEKKHKRNIVGTGLGLSIVKSILESHHYVYGVYSILNNGSTFYFEIPLEKEKKH